MGSVPDRINWVAWQKPKMGWCKLNIDGAWLSEREAGGGGLIRGDTGEWLRGITVKVTARNPICAEALALEEGLKLAWDLKVEKLEVESDAFDLILAIKGLKDIPEVEGLLHNIHYWMKQDWEITLTHVFREANKCADCLAQLGVKQGRRRLCWTLPPPELENLLRDDLEGRKFLRRVA